MPTKIDPKTTDAHVLYGVLKETDRGCVLIMAEWASHVLKELLLSHMPNKNKVQQMFEFNGPFGTFSSRLKVAYHLGFISEECFKNLDKLRDIRNDLAHSVTLLDLRSGPIFQKVLQLKGADKVLKHVCSTHKIIDGCGDVEIEVREQEDTSKRFNTGIKVPRPRAGLMLIFTQTMVELRNANGPHSIAT